ncbi:MAG: cation:proton antiporter [Peptococcaceae bacterium]|nr:cation:proton antiporter [Peptococcaceae bacterium]
MIGETIFQLGILLLFVALAGLFSSKLKFPIVPSLIVAGLAVSALFNVIHYNPDEAIINTIPTKEAIELLGEVGVLFLLFALGLEFSIKKLLNSLRTVLTSGLLYLSIVGTSALVFAVCMGWALPEILLAFGIIIISSSAIVAKTLVDMKRTANPETEVILGLMLFQDIFMAIFLPIVAAIALAHSGTPWELATSIGFAFLFIILFVVVSLKTSLLEKILNIASDEVFLLVIIGALFFIAGTSYKLDISDAIGALILGMVLAETSHKERIMHMVVPYRDFFGAAFFFAFGFSITLNGEMLTQSLPAALIAVVLTLVGSMIYGIVMSKMAKINKRGAVNVGLTIVSRGEFSIILAGMGLTAGLSNSLWSFAVLYVVILAISGPLLSRFSDQIAQGMAKIFRWKLKQKKTKTHPKGDPSLLRDA